MIQDQRIEIEELKAKKTRKKVTVDPNKRFADIENIKAAQDEAETAQVKKKKQKRWN